MRSITRSCSRFAGLALVGAMAAALVPLARAAESGDFSAAGQAAQRDLARKYPEDAPRSERGVAAVLAAWRQEDGDASALGDFLRTEFIPRGPDLDRTFDRFEFAFERLSGYMVSLSRDWRRGVDLDLGPQLPLDSRLAAFDPAAHVTEDLFKTKVAFVALLNFPPTTLDERLAQGAAWSRRQWAEARLAERFSARVPGDVQQNITAAFAATEDYINGYNFYLRHVVDGSARVFPPGLRLISHWGLRDELKARYSDPLGLTKQRLIEALMERIVTQTVPRRVIGKEGVDWNPYRPARDDEREMDDRYRVWLDVFRAVRRADPYDRANPTFIDRRFNVDRELPEPQVLALLEAVLTSPLGAQVAALIEKRLGRPLEPFDVWYAGFKPRARFGEAELDAKTRAHYPSAEAFKADLPRILETLGFRPERARFVADHVVVEPSRGAGHALGMGRRDDAAHLRTRVGPQGMDYKGYNIAVHEFGHNCEQVFSTVTVDHALLAGVPNNAFTEALAFLFQARDLELLGLGAPDARARAAGTLEEFWATREIAGVALIDIRAWHWLYEHPDATPAQFRAAVVGLAREVWNRYYEPLLHGKDTSILGVYSHLVEYGLYTPDYFVGHLIAFQVDAHFRASDKPFGDEFERITRLGRLTPDAWMRQAAGAPLSAAPLLAAAEQALAEVTAASR